MSAIRLVRVDPDDWVVAAACKGNRELFFPPDVFESRTERHRREAAAKRICADCPVRAECLAEAFESRERFGIWGGLTERERRAAFARQRPESPLDIAGPGRPSSLPAVVVRGRPMSSEPADG